MHGAVCRIFLDSADTLKGDVEVFLTRIMPEARRGTQYEEKMHTA